MATLLGGVNKQNFKVEFQKIFLFFLSVFFCCDIGVSVPNLKNGGPRKITLYKKFVFRSESLFKLYSTISVWVAI